VVQEPAGQVAQAGAQRDERGGGGGGLQVRIRDAVHAAVRGRLAVQLVPVQQLDQGALAAGHQALPVAGEPTGVDGGRQPPPELGELLQHGGQRGGGEHEQRLDAAGVHGLLAEQQQQRGGGGRPLPVHHPRQPVHVPLRRRALHEQQHELQHRHPAAEGQAARLRRLRQPLLRPLPGLPLQLRRPVRLPVHRRGRDGRGLRKRPGCAAQPAPAPLAALLGRIGGAPRRQRDATARGQHVAAQQRRRPPPGPLRPGLGPLQPPGRGQPQSGGQQQVPLGGAPGQQQQQQQQRQRRRGRHRLKNALS